MPVMTRLAVGYGDVTVVTSIVQDLAEAGAKERYSGWDVEALFECREQNR